MNFGIQDTLNLNSPLLARRQSLKTVKNWFSESGFYNIVVEYGPNGIVDRGQKTITS